MIDVAPLVGTGAWLRGFHPKLRNDHPNGRALLFSWVSLQQNVTAAVKFAKARRCPDP